MKQHKFIGLLLASLILPLLLWACDPDEDDDTTSGGSTGTEDKTAPTAVAITTAGASGGSVTINQANVDFTITGADTVGVSHFFAISVTTGATTPSKPAKDKIKSSGNSGWVAVKDNTPKALSEKVKLNGHAGLLPADRTSKDLYVFLKDAAGNVSAASSKLAVTVDATALVLADDLLTAGYYIYKNGKGAAEKDYIAIPANNIAWDFLNVTAAANSNKVVGPVGATIAAYDAGGALESSDTSLGADEKIKVTNGDSNREYTIKVRAAGPTLKVHASANDRLYVDGTGTDSVGIVFGSDFDDKVQYQKVASSVSSASNKPGDYTDVGASGADVSSVTAGDKFFLIVKRDGATPASMPSAAVTVTAAPSRDDTDGTGTTFKLATTNNTQLNVKVATTYGFQFRTSEATPTVGSWKDTDVSAGVDITLAGGNNTGTKAALGFTDNGKTATYIRLRLKSTIAKAGLTSAWVAVTPAAAPTAGTSKTDLTDKYYVEEGTAADTFKVYAATTYEYLLGNTAAWKSAWVTAATAGATISATGCSGSSPCTKVKFRKKAVTTSGSEVLAGKETADIAAPTYAKPTITTMTMANVASGTAGTMENGDTITIVFSEAMDAAGMGRQFFIEAKHTGGKVVKIHKGGSGTGAVIADFTTQHQAASGSTSATFTGMTMGTWSANNTTLTLILAGGSGMAKATGTLTAARIQVGSVDAAGNAATANAAATTADPRDTF